MPLLHPPLVNITMSGTSLGFRPPSNSGNLGSVPDWLGNKGPTGHTAKKKVCLLRFAYHLPSFERITYFTKNISCVILFQPSMCVAVGPGQDMFESTQIIGRIIYDKAKVSCGPCAFIFIQNYTLKSTDIFH